MKEKENNFPMYFKFMDGLYSRLIINSLEKLKWDILMRIFF